MLDFGLAKEVGGRRSTSHAHLGWVTRRTGYGDGDPAYMSPEQTRTAAGSPRRHFSLGVMLHEMATGVRPSRGILRELFPASAGAPASVTESCAPNCPAIWPASSGAAWKRTRATAFRPHAMSRKSSATWR